MDSLKSTLLEEETSLQRTPSCIRVHFINVSLYVVC